MYYLSSKTQKNSCHNCSYTAVFVPNYSAISLSSRSFCHADVFFLLVTVDLTLNGDIAFVTDLFQFGNKSGVVYFTLTKGTSSPR